MKTWWLGSWIVALGILGAGGCTEGSGPTDPGGGVNLQGAWTGTITHSDPVCAREGVTVALSQEGTALRGSFQTSCQGMLDLRGELSGGSISGELSRAPGGASIGQILGTATASSVRITTWRSQATREAPGERTIVNVIELAR